MGTRDKLLNILRNSKGDWISGEMLSAQLGISRAAVSKHVASLKQAGYTIESLPGKGYSFQDIPDVMIPGEILHDLETLRFGKGLIEYHDAIRSTNDRAKELASQGAEEGTLVVADDQISGRGRRGRVWYTSKGKGICLSMILRPKMTPAEASRITLLTAVALAETLIRLTSLPVRIKWPNDILIHGKKLAGILTEMSMDMDQIDHVVVGLGMNVNSTKDEIPSPVRDIATSLRAECGIEWKRSEIIKHFLSAFERDYDEAASHGFKDIMRRWKTQSDIIGKNVEVDLMRSRVRGRVLDVDDDGVLIIKDEKGDIHRVISGDVLLSA